MKDYTAESIVQVFDNKMGTVEGYASFKGVTEIEGMFGQLITDIDAANDANGIGLAVKLLEVEPKFNGVFLVWESTSHTKATDNIRLQRCKQDHPPDHRCGEKNPLRRSLLGTTTSPLSLMGPIGRAMPRWTRSC